LTRSDSMEGSRNDSRVNHHGSARIKVDLPDRANLEHPLVRPACQASFRSVVNGPRRGKNVGLGFTEPTDLARLPSQGDLDSGPSCRRLDGAGHGIPGSRRCPDPRLRPQANRPRSISLDRDDPRRESKRGGHVRDCAGVWERRDGTGRREPQFPHRFGALRGCMRPRPDPKSVSINNFSLDAMGIVPLKY
jgi:hypothetical protein